MTQKPAPSSHREARPRLARITGLRHLCAATTYSLAGVRRLWGETAFRHEVLALPLVMGLFAASGAALWHFIGAFVLWALLVAVEALNTAIEELVDHVSPDWSVFARNAKDLGSLAVMCLLLANGAFIGAVLYTLHVV